MLILITGGKSGVGRALAEQLKKRAIVIATSRQVGFNNSLNLQPGEIFFQQLDVSNEESVLRLFRWLQLLPFKLDSLINNAGIGFFNPIESVETKEWESIIQTNLTGAFLCAREAFKLMKESGGGRIINIGSIASKVPFTNNLAYGASKWGLKGLSANLGEEGKPYKIYSTHVTLGATYTDIWKSRPEFSPDDMLNTDEVAKSLAHLVLLPLNIAINEIEILPRKGVL